MYIPKEQINSFFQDINSFGISYVLIKNMDDELPAYLENGKDIDILVKEEDKDLFAQKMLGLRYQSCIPPCGISNGWSFAYGLTEYQFWKKPVEEYDIYIDACFKLCCKSLTPKVWIPLDKKINNDIWEQRVWNEKQKWYELDEKTEVIYLVVRSIFDKHVFSNVYKKEIEKRKNLLKECDVREKLQLVFFHFTDTLIEMVLNGRYEEIIPKYLSFTEY